MKRIGLFGGTFNPVHLGHLELAEYARDEINLDAVIFIPSASPPHKTQHQIQPFEHRVKMLSLALKDSDYFSISEVEGLLSSPSYSIDMLNQLLQITTDEVDYYFIIGIDAFLEIHLWKKFEEVLGSVHFIVAARCGIAKDTMERYISDLGYEKKEHCWYSFRNGKSIYYLEKMVKQISSSELRDKLIQTIAIETLPPGVGNYIDMHGLYGRKC